MHNNIFFLSLSLTTFTTWNNNEEISTKTNVLQIVSMNCYRNIIF